ncbi:hypothetical protein [Hydrogenophaga sp.]|uniref:hypothetical protein n=1 Tax=Hydrogenophaga sp. TaxID=1904254 RepID=UPI003D09E62B
MLQTLIINAGQRLEFYEPGDFFRLMEATDPVTVQWYKNGAEVAEAPGVKEGYAETFGLGTFDRIAITSATTQAIQFVVRLGNRVLYDTPPVGDTSIVSSVPLALDAATLLALSLQHRPGLPGASWSSVATIAANTPLTIFAAGANPNGAIIWSMEADDASAGAMYQSFIAKATAPANVADGEVLAHSRLAIASTTNVFSLRREVPTRIAPGLGLFFISSSAGTASQLRNCRYSLL